MASNPGDYQDYLTHYAVSKEEQSTGQRLPTYTAVGFVWGDVVHDSSNKEERYGADRRVIGVTIRVPMPTDVSALDRLYSAEWNETYILNSRRRGDDEWIFDADFIEGFDLDRMVD